MSAVSLELTRLTEAVGAGTKRKGQRRKGWRRLVEALMNRVLRVREGGAYVLRPVR